MIDGLAGRTILITGAGGGIGAETARVCASFGASLVLTDLSAPDPLAREIAELHGTPAVSAALDVTDRPATERLVEGLDRLDAVVANAGICPWDDWNADGWDEAFHRVIDVNVLGVINVVRPSMTRMEAQGGGRIVLVTSVAARMGGLRSSPHYVASKGGVSAMLKWFARKGAAANINVNAVAPGATETPMTADIGFDPGVIPLGRMARAREIALPIAFLCSDGASYLCGATLDVNGGVYLN